MTQLPFCFLHEKNMSTMCTTCTTNAILASLTIRDIDIVVFLKQEIINIYDLCICRENYKLIFNIAFVSRQQEKNDENISIIKTECEIIKVICKMIFFEQKLECKCRVNTLYMSHPYLNYLQLKNIYILTPKKYILIINRYFIPEYFIPKYTEVNQFQICKIYFKSGAIFKSQILGLIRFTVSREKESEYKPSFHKVSFIQIWIFIFHICVYILYILCARVIRLILILIQLFQ